MVSAISLCLLAIGITAASSQQLSTEVESVDVPISDRRTFKHGKPVKVLPLAKKHKKFAGFVPHVFGKPSYAEVPVLHEIPRPLYKVHRYQGIELKPVPEISISTPEPFIETHSAEPPSDFGPAFEPSFPAPFHSSNILLLPINDKPVFSSSAFSSPHPGPVFASLPPPLPPKPIYSFVPAPPQPIFPSLPITSVPSIVSVARPAPPPIFSQPPPFPVFSSIPIKVQPPVLPPLPPPSPSPVLPSVPVKIPSPVLPSIPASPAPPALPTVSITPPPLAHPFPSLPPPSLQFVPAPSPLPISSFQTFPSPAPALSSISISATPEPEFPYPPSGVPIPSYIKDISLGNIEIKDSPLPTIETPKYQEVTPTVAENDPQGVKHISAVTAEDGLFNKLKGWKAEKANAALNHLSSFKQKPFAHFSIPFHHSSNKIPLEIPTSQPPTHPTVQFPAPIHPLPLAQAPAFFPPPPHFFPPAKYESFPPNNIESPAVFNSYGAPVSHDYGPPHDRLSSAASEEEPAVVPAPKEQNPGQKPEPQQRPSAQLLQEFQSQNFQGQFQSQSIPHVQPVYVPEDSKSPKEEVKAAEETQPDVDDYTAPKEADPEAEDSEAHTYRNHKE